MTPQLVLLAVLIVLVLILAACVLALQSQIMQTTKNLDSVNTYIKGNVELNKTYSEHLALHGKEIERLGQGISFLDKVRTYVSTGGKEGWPT